MACARSNSLNYIYIIFFRPTLLVLVDLGINTTIAGIISFIALYLLFVIILYPKILKYKTKEEKTRERENRILVLQEEGVLSPYVAIDIKQRMFIYRDEVYPFDNIRD